MKYIRTKDGIYEIVDFDNECIIPSPIIKMNGKLTHCADYKNYKQADTIEKLCDGVIEKCLSGNRFCPIEMFNKEKAIKCMNIDFNKGYKQFYFGIFAEHNDKIDFISVAKMNDKGELELI